MLGLEINNTEGISHYKDPTRIYQNATCNDCIPSLYLFGIANDRVGNRRLKLQIYFDRQTGQADRQTGRQADRQTGRQADRQTGQQAGRQTGRQAGRQAESCGPYQPTKSNDFFT